MSLQQSSAAPVRNAGCGSAAERTVPGSTPAGETAGEWADRMLAERGPMPEHVATRVREAFEATRRRRRQQRREAS